jgi:hypothetical protein
MDPVLLSPIRYNPQSPTTVFAESHVFKFADASQLHFNCQVQVCLKADNECEKIIVSEVSLRITDMGVCTAAKMCDGQTTRVTHSTRHAVYTCDSALNQCTHRRTIHRRHCPAAHNI